MTREEAKDLLLNISAYDIDMQRGMAKQEAIEMAIKALEQEPCEDAISRQAAIDALTKTSGIRGDALKALYDLSYVSTEKTGQWIDRFPLKECKCSECDYLIMLSFGSFSEVIKQMKYCPNCGAKMQEVEE